MDKTELKEKIKEIVQKQIKEPKCKVFFFGSRVNGDSTNRSDYDVGILTDKQVPSKLLRKIKEELNNLRVMQKFDVVDFKSVNDDFKNIALKKVEIIYER